MFKPTNVEETTAILVEAGIAERLLEEVRRHDYNLPDPLPGLLDCRFWVVSEPQTCLRSSCRCPGHLLGWSYKVVAQFPNGDTRRRYTENHIIVGVSVTFDDPLDWEQVQLVRKLGDEYQANFRTISVLHIGWNTFPVKDLADRGVRVAKLAPLMNIVFAGNDYVSGEARDLVQESSPEVWDLVVLNAYHSLRSYLDVLPEIMKTRTLIVCDGKRSGEYYLSEYGLQWMAPVESKESVKVILEMLAGIPPVAREIVAEHRLRGNTPSEETVFDYCGDYLDRGM